MAADAGVGEKMAAAAMVSTAGERVAADAGETMVAAAMLSTAAAKVIFPFKEI